MRIVYFVQHFLSNSETFIEQQLSGIAQSCKILVVCLTASKQADYEVMELGFEYGFINRVSRHYYLSFRNKSFATSLSRTIAAFEPDIIHCHFGIQSLYLYDNLDSLDIPQIVTFHGYDVGRYSREFWYRTRLRTLFSKISLHPIFVCKYHRAFFQQLNIYSPRNLILYNGVNTNFYTRSPRSENVTTQFTQIGRFVEKKGFQYTIAAFARVCKEIGGRKIFLKLVGDGPLRKELEEQVSRLKIVDRVQFAGFLDREHVKMILEETSVYIQASVTARDGDCEATTVTILEAMAMELPVIATRHAGIPEVLPKDLDRILVEEKDVDALARAMIQFSGQGYSSANREYVEKNHNLETRNHALLNHYQSILATT